MDRLLHAFHHQPGTVRGGNGWAKYLGNGKIPGHLGIGESVLPEGIDNSSIRFVLIGREVRNI